MTRALKDAQREIFIGEILSLNQDLDMGPPPSVTESTLHFPTRFILSFHES